MSDLKELLKAIEDQEKMIKSKEPFFEKIRKEQNDYLIRLQVLREINEDERSNFPGVRGKIELQLNGLATTDPEYAILVNEYQKLLNNESWGGDWGSCLREALLRCNMVERYAEDIDLCSCINKVLGVED